MSLLFQKLNTKGHKCNLCLIINFFFVFSSTMTLHTLSLSFSLSLSMFRGRWLTPPLIKIGFDRTWKLKPQGLPMTHKISLFANVTNKINHKSFPNILTPTNFRVVTVLNTDGNFAGVTDKFNRHYGGSRRRNRLQGRLTKMVATINTAA